jgi:hypothetical protein
MVGWGIGLSTKLVVDVGGKIEERERDLENKRL